MIHITQLWTNIDALLLLLTKVLSLFRFPLFLSNVLFLFQGSTQDITLHLVIVSWLWQFLRLSLFLVTIMRSIGQVLFFSNFWGFFGHVVWLAGSQFPDQGLNLGHGSESQEKPGILTMRPPGNSHWPSIFWVSQLGPVWFFLMIRVGLWVLWKMIKEAKHSSQQLYQEYMLSTWHSCC